MESFQLDVQPGDFTPQKQCRVFRVETGSGVMVSFTAEHGHDVVSCDSRVLRYLREHPEVNQYKAGWQPLFRVFDGFDSVLNRKAFIEIMTTKPYEHIKVCNYHPHEYAAGEEVQFMMYLASSCESHVEIISTDYLRKHDWQLAELCAKRLGMEQYREPYPFKDGTFAPPDHYFARGRNLSNGEESACLAWRVKDRHTRTVDTQLGTWRRDLEEQKAASA